MPNGREVYETAYRAGWRPEPRLSVSAWADEHVVLGNRAGHAAIRFRTATTPYVREILDALGPRSPARRVVMMSGTQLGKSQTGLNWLAFIMAHCPGPILVVRPTVDEARRFSRQRLDPLIATTPALRELVKEARSRDGGNSLLIKEFPGGVLFLTGSNSATGVKSMPIRWLFCDEVRNYPPGRLDMVLKRTRSFWNSRRFLISTPGTKGDAMDTAYRAGDQRVWQFECPAWIRCLASR